MSATNPALKQGASESSAWWEQFTSAVGGVLFSPVATMRRFRDEPQFLSAFLLVFLIAVLEASVRLLAVLTGATPATGSRLVPGSEQEFYELSVVEQMSVFIGQGTGLLWQLALWLLGAGLIYGISYMLGGRAPFLTFWAATGFAFAPQLLLVPFRMLVDVLALINLPFQIAGWLALAPFRLLVFVWFLALLAIAVREIMHVSTGRAVIAVTLPFLIASFLIAAMILMFLAFIFGIIGLFV